MNLRYFTLLSFSAIERSVSNSTLLLTPPLKSAVDTTQKKQPATRQNYNYLKYGAVAGAILLTATVAYSILPSTFIFSENVSPVNHNSSSVNPIQNAITSIALYPSEKGPFIFNGINLSKILPFNFPLFNFDSTTSFKTKLSWPLIEQQIYSSYLTISPPTSHSLNLSTINSCYPLAKIISPNDLDSTQKIEMENSCIPQSKQRFDDSSYIDPKEFDDVQNLKISNWTLENKILVSTGLSALASTITYFAAEHFYPALQEVSKIDTKYETIPTQMLNGFDETWTSSQPNALVYKNFMELLNAIQQSKGRINQLAALEDLVKMIEHILIPENAAYTQLERKTLNALKQLRFDYLQTIQKFTQTPTTRFLTLDRVHFLADAISNIITGANQFIHKQFEGSSLEKLNLVVKEMFTITKQPKFKIINKLTKISKKVITQYRRDSFSLQFAAIAFMISTIASGLWFKNNN